MFQSARCHGDLPVLERISRNKKSRTYLRSILQRPGHLPKKDPPLCVPFSRRGRFYPGSKYKSLQEAHRPLEGSNGHPMDLPPHDCLQKVRAGCQAAQLQGLNKVKDVRTPKQMGAYQIRRRKSTRRFWSREPGRI